MPELKRIAQLSEPDPVPKSFVPVLSSHRATIREAARSIERLRAEVSRLSAASTGSPDTDHAGRTTAEAWRAAAIQAKNDLRAIEDAFAEATPVGEDGPDPPIGPGTRFAQWASPAITMRWIEEMEDGAATGSTEQEGSGVSLIAAERRRQAEEEGYDAEHDDAHSDGMILGVAQEILAYLDPLHAVDPDDPWGLIAKHERRGAEGRARLLVIAGALVAAEIDRVSRAGEGEEGGER